VQPQDADATPLSTLALLAQLVNKSLVVVLPNQSDEARYGLLETIRLYGAEKLHASGRAPLWRARHRDWYLALAEATAPLLTQAQQVACLNRLEGEQSNLRAALACSLERGDAEQTLRLVAALWRFWEMRGHLSEGRRWAEAALAASNAPVHPRAQALRGLGVLALRQGDLLAARTQLEASLALCRELGDERGIAGSLNYLGVATPAPVSSARRYFEESLTIFRKLANTWGAARALQNLGINSLMQDDYQSAIQRIEDGLQLQREAGDQRLIAMSLAFLGHAVLYQGDATRALNLLVESLAIQQQIGDKVFMTYCLIGLAGVALAQDQLARAAHLLGAAEALREAVGAPLLVYYRDQYDRIVAAARDRLNPPALEAWWAEGRSMKLPAVIEYALRQGSHNY
jgi:tetratricopeptide (TPR) repeat protein